MTYPKVKADLFFLDKSRNCILGVFAKKIRSGRLIRQNLGGRTKIETLLQYNTVCSVVKLMAKS